MTERLRLLPSLLLLCTLLCACTDKGPVKGPRRIQYWEKWTGFEGEAARSMVEDFNRRQREIAAMKPGYRPIVVELVTTSQIDRKLLVAIAGGDAPDVAGLYTFALYSYARKGALTDLTDDLRDAGIARSHYIPAYWDMCEYQGRMWAIPTTPATTALHWNKRLFREAGLDPHRPPRTIAELDRMAARLTVWEVTHEDGTKETVRGFLPEKRAGKWRLMQAGFLPNEPGWWNWSWGFYFGGRIWDEKGTVTADAPENLAAFEWIQSYSKRIGVENIQRFQSGFGNFSSPQNAFMSGKIAMEMQGVWMYNFIEMYAPGMQWGAAPFPGIRASHAGAGNAYTNSEADVLVIPKDCPHPEEAFEFVKFVASQEGIEILCKGHRKFSPLAEESEHFRRTHPHPYLRLFRDMAYSPHAFSTPKMGIWNEYRRELGTTFERIQNMNATPREALGALTRRMQKSMDRDRARAERRQAMP